MEALSAHLLSSFGNKEEDLGQCESLQRTVNWRVKCHVDAGDANNSRLRSKKKIDDVPKGRSS